MNKLNRLALLLIVVLLAFWGLNAWFETWFGAKLVVRLEKEGIRAYGKITEKEISFLNRKDYGGQDVAAIKLDFKKSKDEYGTMDYVYFDAKGRMLRGSTDYVDEETFRETQLGDWIKIIYDPDWTNFNTTAEKFDKNRIKYGIPKGERRSWPDIDEYLQRISNVTSYAE